MPKREDEFWAAQKEGRGRGLCPRCGSSDISYNPKFESWRCNKCEHSFPMPSYGPGGEFGKEARWFGKTTEGERRKEFAETARRKRESESRDKRKLKFTYSQTRRKHDYPRHVRIISNIILSLIVILVIGLVGGGIYGISKYHGDAWHWVSHSLADKVIIFTEDIPNLINTSKDKVANSEIVKTITDAFNKEKTPTPETITPPTTTTPNPVGPSSPEVFQTGASYTNEEVEELVYVLINNERQSFGLSPLSKDPLLTSLAREHSISMATHGFFSHDRAAGERDFGYGQPPGTTRGENISKTPQREWIPGSYLTLKGVSEWAVSGWMGSTGHRQNILESRFTETGVGVSRAGEYLYITQMFEGSY